MNETNEEGTKIYLEPKQKINIFPKYMSSARYFTIACDTNGKNLYIVHLGKRYSLNRFYEELDDYKQRNKMR